MGTRSDRFLVIVGTTPVHFSMQGIPSGRIKGFPFIRVRAWLDPVFSPGLKSLARAKEMHFRYWWFFLPGERENQRRDKGNVTMNEDRKDDVDGLFGKPRRSDILGRLGFYPGQKMEKASCPKAKGRTACPTSQSTILSTILSASTQGRRWRRLAALRLRGELHALLVR
uniref:Uncharacterized protein n=1 Tax=Tanacetum cinerariifolium TaxID=118510 RepID=A0A6L2N0E4_TANCI|nr:hypothetical protein [Tanacetum cinerariifolium]